jgi:hypothetical protein
MRQMLLSRPEQRGRCSVELNVRDDDRTGPGMPDRQPQLADRFLHGPAERSRSVTIAGSRWGASSSERMTAAGPPVTTTRWAPRHARATLSARSLMAPARSACEASAVVAEYPMTRATPACRA